MSEIMSHNIEVAAFCRAVREPDLSSALMVIALGRATVAFIEACDGLERALTDLYGEDRATVLVAPLQRAAQETRRKIDAAS